MARPRLNLPVSGSKVLEQRIRRQWHQIEVTERTARCGARVPRSRLSRIENGHERPTGKQLRALAAVFKVQVDDLLEDQAEDQVAVAAEPGTDQ